MQKTSCDFFILEKRRKCRVEKYKDSQYCIFHSNPEDSGRVKCPIDPSHSIARSNLQNHLLICQKQKENVENKNETWFKADVNNFSLDFTDSNKQSFQTISEEKLTKISEKILELFESMKDLYFSNMKNKDFGKLFQSLPLLDFKSVFEFPESVLQKPKESNKENKNTKSELQCLKIVELANSLEIIKENSLFIEFGAGKGRLSHTFASQNIKSDKTAFLLIERENRRHKFDKNHRDKEWKRLRCDIKDLDFSKVPELFSNLKSVNTFGISKHACGLATDLAIKSTLLSPNPYAMILTSCCHHLCNESCEYLAIPLAGFSNEEKKMFFGISSWALSSFPIALQEEKAKEQRKLGLIVKRIIDLSRCQYLSSIGWSSCLVKYCNEETTPENIAIIALKL